MFKQRKHKRFNYKPRFQDGKDTSLDDDFETKWRHTRESSKNRGRLYATLPRLLLMLIVMLLLMYILKSYE